MATKHRESLNQLQVADVPRGALSNQDTLCHLALSGGDRAGGEQSSRRTEAPTCLGGEKPRRSETRMFVTCTV